MTLATGGLAFGEISMRSSPTRSASARASASDRTPRFSPVDPTTRSSLARISLFMRILSVVLKCFWLMVSRDFSTGKADKQGAPECRTAFGGVLACFYYGLILTEAVGIFLVLNSRRISLKSCKSWAQASRLAWSVWEQCLRIRSGFSLKF